MANDLTPIERGLRPAKAGSLALPETRPLGTLLAWRGTVGDAVRRHQINDIANTVIAQANGVARVVDAAAPAISDPVVRYLRDRYVRGVK